MSISASSAPASASIRLSGQAVCDIAAHQGKTETQLIAEINRSRGIVGLSVAIRRYKFPYNIAGAHAREDRRRALLA